MVKVSDHVRKRAHEPTADEVVFTAADVPVTTEQMRDRALDYAAKGYAVFPLKVGRKDPAMGNGHLRATTDPDQAKRWWSDPDRPFNIGISAVGSGLVAVDIDVKKADGRASWRQATRGRDIPGLEFAVLTPSGGEHHYYRHDYDEVKIPLGVNIVPGVDVRSSGYVVAPGSYTVGSPDEGTCEGYYSVEGQLDLPSVDQCPATSRDLVTVLKARESKERSEHHDAGSTGLPLGVSGQWAALQGEHEILANTTDGRNTQLNTSTLKLARIVAGGGALTRDIVYAALMAACRINGLYDEEPEKCEATFRSGWEAGITDPRPVATDAEVADLMFERDVAQRVRLKQIEREAQRRIEISHQAETGHTVDAGSFVFDQRQLSGGLWGRGQQILWAEGEALMLVGPPGVGKTTLVGQLVRARLGLGDAVLGYPVKATESKVLYLAMDRPKQIARSLARHFDPSERATLSERMVVHQGPPPGDIANDDELLLRMAQAVGADTVIVDSLKDAAVGLSKDEVGAAYNRARQRLLANDIEIVELHHQRKSGGSEGAKPNSLADVYGSTWITSGAGSVVLLWGEAGDIDIELIHLKPSMEPVGPLKVHHDHAAGVSSVITGSDPLAVLINAGEQGMTPRDLAEAMGRGTEKKEVERSRRDLDRLVSAGLAETTKETRAKQTATVYRATDHGRLSGSKDEEMVL